MDESLSFESFYEGAKKATYKAMNDHAEGEYDEFALHAGVAIERLAKAVLYKLNPLYIASGKVVFTANKPPRVHTVSAMEALSRLTSLNILKIDADLKLLIELRNGTVHASAGDEAKAHIPTLAKAVGAMLKHLDVSMPDFWGRWASTASAAVDQKKSEIERDVQVRITQAKHHYDNRFSDLPDHLHRRLVVEQFSQINVSVSETEAGIWIEGENVCPACDCVADVLAVGQSTGEASPVSVFALKCHLCRLQLATREELAAAGMDLETVDEQLAARAARYLGGSEISNVAFRRKVAHFLHSDLGDWE
ncbi:hypothetical protein [Streptomyces sp. NPDC096012]|uniref:hypothetical protein n=1 Tax=Streptomyces sp. NPDC096012 TaxID=3155684 RepID=UPI003369E092